MTPAVFKHWTEIEVFLSDDCRVLDTRHTFHTVVTPASCLFGLVRCIQPGEMIPRGFGYVCFDAARFVEWFAPIPLNVAVRLGLIAWAFCKVPLPRVRLTLSPR